VTCADFRTLAPPLSLGDLHDCERHLQFCPGCRAWLRATPPGPPYDAVRQRWQDLRQWLTQPRAP
jgi:hypothetical protein